MQCNEQYHELMGRGLLSTAGWAALDDGVTARLVPAPNNPAGLPFWWSLDSLPVSDVYFHAHPQLDFKGALADWVSVLGRPEMLPRSAFGVWWSRYYPYTQDTIVSEVLSGYANFSLPLNNLVLDMDVRARPPPSFFLLPQ